MIEMRWLVTTSDNPKLQYRQQVDMNVRAGTGWIVSGQTTNMQWTDWKDVPNVNSEEIVNANC
jgi:hypothetical protein